MRTSSSLRTVFLLQAIFTALLSPLAVAQNSDLFAEYIGAEFTGVKFSDIPVNPDVYFHFILAFAIDYSTATSPASPTNGKFGVFWDSGNLSPADVLAVKQANPNVKVALSLGGDTVSGNPAYFDPTTIDSWVDNAVTSLTSIIQDFHLDGLDVDYEHFKADSATFSECIGRLIAKLKSNGVISFASIAPFDNSDVQDRYRTLWADHGAVIDYVNFQFYAYSSGTTVAQFLDHYETQRTNYAGGRVLVSFATGSGAGGLSPANGFFDACRRLKDEGELEGIFVWSADNSQSDGFVYEKEAQSLLAGS